MSNVRNLIIIGSGPATHTAAIYAARASLQPLVLQLQDPPSAAQAADKARPGFPAEATQGELLAAMQQQAERFGATYVRAQSVRLKVGAPGKTVTADKQDHEAHAVVFADGAAAALGELPRGDGLFACPSVSHGLGETAVVIAAGEGCQAAIEAERFLQSHQVTSPDQRTENW